MNHFCQGINCECQRGWKNKCQKISRGPRQPLSVFVTQELLPWVNRQSYSVPTESVRLTHMHNIEKEKEIDRLKCFSRISYFGLIKIQSGTSMRTTPEESFNVWFPFWQTHRTHEFPPICSVCVLNWCI